jgi:hypothetical protein
MAGRWQSQAPVWDAFGLSYASYLVYPRVLLCEMPREWQAKLVALLDEFHEIFQGYEPPRGYAVLPRSGRGQYGRDPLADYRHPPAEMIARFRKEARA